MPADHANGMDERELVGITARLVARLVHQLAQREMHQQQAMEFLFNQIDPMAAQEIIARKEKSRLVRKS
jgi:hypothetical protein